MAKFKVNVGGFVSTYRERNLIIHAADESEAAEKAELKFIDLQQEARTGNMCDEGIINSIEQID